MGWNSAPTDEFSKLLKSVSLWSHILSFLFLHRASNIANQCFSVCCILHLSYERVYGIVSHLNFSFLFVFLMCDRFRRVACGNPCILCGHLLILMFTVCIHSIKVNLLVDCYVVYLEGKVLYSLFIRCGYAFQQILEYNEGSVQSSDSDDGQLCS